MCELTEIRVYRSTRENSAHTHFLWDTKVLLSIYSVHIESIDQKAQNRGWCKGKEAEKLFLSWHDTEMPNPSVLEASHWLLYRSFCILPPRLLWSANPFACAPRHFGVWLTYLPDVKMYHKKGSKTTFQGQRMRNCKSSKYRMCSRHALPVWHSYHICYCCFSRRCSFLCFWSQF